jgi:hypothetical protein
MPDIVILRPAGRNTFTFKVKCTEVMKYQKKFYLDCTDKMTLYLNRRAILPFIHDVYKTKRAENIPRSFQIQTNL